MPNFQNDQWQEALVALANSGILNLSAVDLPTTGTISAAQPVINTPVANATVVLAVGSGQSSWKAMLTNGGGGFTSGTTIVADKSIDNGVTWFTASFKITGGSPATTVSSVVGPGPIEITGNAADVSHVRIRCSVLNSTETIAVTLRAGVGIADIGLMSSIPAGANLMGGVNLIDSAGTNKAAIDTNGNQAVKGGFTEIAGQGTGVVNGLNTDLIPSTDVSAYTFMCLQITGTWAGTLTFQGSNDNVNFNSFELSTPIPTTVGYSTATSVNGAFIGLLPYRYLRVRMTAFTSNASLAATLELYTGSRLPLVLFSQTMQQGAWTVQPGNTQNTTPWLIQGPTNTFTQAANTAGNVVGKASAGALWSAVITTTGTAGLDIFDNASTNSGTKLLSIPANAPVGTIYNFLAGQPAASGITSAGVTNCPGVTFGYR